MLGKCFITHLPIPVLGIVLKVPGDLKHSSSMDPGRRTASPIQGGPPSHSLTQPLRLVCCTDKLTVQTAVRKS